MSSKKRSAGTAALDAAADDAAATTAAHHASSTAAAKQQKGAGQASPAAAAAAGKKNNSVAAPPAVAASAAAAAASAPPATALTPASYSAVALAHATKFKSYVSDTNDKAHRVLHGVLPKKVLELDHLIQTHAPFAHNVEPPYAADGSMIPGRAAAEIPSNPSVAALIPTVKTEVLALIEHLGALKLMIQLRIPSVDDGNNFGVEIQEESINEIAKVEDVEFLWLDKLANYHGNRTRIIAKISKYPGILDYWSSVRELDESFFVDMRMHMVDMRNSYLLIKDLLSKNEERIKNPRGEENAEEGRNRRHAFA